MFLAQALKMGKISLRKRQIFKSYLYPDIATLSIDIDIITQNTFKILSFHILPEVQQCNSFTLQYLTSRLLKSLHFTIKREVNGHLISQYKLDMSNSKRTCCVPICNSGRKDCVDEVTWHAVREDWIPHFPKITWKYTSSSKICSKHFKEDDFKSKSSDSNSTRRTLLPNAVPSIWQDIPQSKLKCIPPPRKAARSSAETRRLAEEDMLVKKDTISGLDRFTTECIKKKKI